MIRLLTFCTLALALLTSAATPALAHKPSDSYLKISVQENVVEGQWDIALRDLDHAIGLDGNDDGSITWGELRARQDSIATYAISRLRIERGDSPCSLVPAAHLVDEHSDGAYAVLRFVAHCAAAAEDAARHRLFAVLRSRSAAPRPAPPRPAEWSLHGYFQPFRADRACRCGGDLRRAPVPPFP